MSAVKVSYVPSPGSIINQLVIKPIFDALEPLEKLYAHHLARAALHGSRIIMRQVSLESTEIFDLILELYHACDGKWETLIARCDITKEELDSFLEYAAVFLCNLGNFYVSDSSLTTIDLLLKANSPQGEGDQKFVPDLSAEALRRIAGASPLTKTRLERIIDPLLSVPPFNLGYPGEKAQSAYYPGTKPISKDEIGRISDIMCKHSIGPENTRIRKVCLALTYARQYASNEKQEKFLEQYIETFRTGGLNAFQESQKIWVTDIAARVENMIGFIEAYRDPAGIRSEWEAMIGIADQTCGFKNVVLANRLSANNNPQLPCYWVDPSELEQFKRTTHIVRFLTTAIHELIGHGTGKLLRETSPGVYNFDKQSPPISPLTKGPVTSHYTSDQTWSNTFRELSGTVEECRAILVSEYLMDKKEVLGIFGYTDESEITSDELLYTTYLNIGVDGLQALEHYNFESKTWGQVHHQAHYSILKHLLQSGSGVIRIDHDPEVSTLTVRVDRTKFHSHGKPVLGDYLCRLHIWRCTADVYACKEWYEPLCEVEGVYEKWRQIVCSKPKPRWKFVQPNTVVTGGEDIVSVKVYEESNEGIIQSWVERGV
ncbi:peptidase family M49-domain-containing protein [Aspergillus heterothallicus]